VGGSPQHIPIVPLVSEISLLIKWSAYRLWCDIVTNDKRGNVKVIRWMSAGAERTGVTND
jgi:hypothetical protein